MKTIVLIILMVFLTLKMTAQIPNADFENWDTFDGYEDPHDWTTLNYLSLQGYPLTATRTTDHYTGNYALRLETKSFVSGAKINLLRGIAVSGDIKKNQPNGFSYSKRPGFLDAYFKYNPHGNDTATVYVTLTKWNATKKSSDIIGGSEIIIANAITYYTKLSAVLRYNFSAVPDTAIILISSSSNVPIAGSVLFVDDISFTEVTSITDYLSTNPSVTLYPNPVSTELYLKNLPADASILQVTDLTGKNMETIALSIDNHGMRINTENYLPGIYFCNIKNNRSEKIYSLKFTVAK